MRTIRMVWLVFTFLAMGVGLYPLMYLLTDGTVGLLNSKLVVLLSSTPNGTPGFMGILFSGELR
ncbi:MAG: hypothetical protein AAGB24_07015 [Bacteroidota bacterium]